MNGDVARDGFATVPGMLSAAERSELVEALGLVEGAGRRGMLGVPAVARLAHSAKLLNLVRPYVAGNPSPVRSLYFDKTADANWLVTWHQDLALAVRKRIEAPGFGPWSVKDGVPHVQAPVELLQQMAAVRLHLDDADEENGALRVAPGSHCLGRVATAEIDAVRRRSGETICRMAAGDALVMRPLLLHASSRSTSARHRRVLHIEYAGFALPAGLAWREAA